MGIKIFGRQIEDCFKIVFGPLQNGRLGDAAGRRAKAPESVIAPKRQGSVLNLLNIVVFSVLGKKVRL
jgi:hypothetical protein